MIEKFKEIGIIAVILMLIAFCAFAGTHDPWDGTLWDVASPDIDQPHGNAYKEIYDLRKGVAIRINKEHETLATSSAGGVHKQGSARAFFQDAAPTTQVDGTAWDSGDKGSFWFDTNATPDNLFYVLTNHASTGTWTLVSTSLIAELLAANRTFAGTLTVTGQSTFNSHVNLGAGDDLIGSSTSDIAFNTNKFTMAGASGNTVMAGTASVGGTLDVTGNIDPTTYETTNGGFLDEDAMGSDAADKVSSQQSIKKYVDDSIEGDSPSPNDSESNAMLKSHAYLAQTSGFVNAFVAGTNIMNAYIGSDNDPAGNGITVGQLHSTDTDRGTITMFVPNGMYFEITTSDTPTIIWTALVSGGGAPIDQD